MVEDRIADGRRIAQLLASEVTGRRDGPFDRLAVTNADPDVEPTVDGARAYEIVIESGAAADGTAGETAESVSETTESARESTEPARESPETADGAPESAASAAGPEPDENDAAIELLATAFVHEDRVRLEFRAGIEAAADAARDAGVRVRPTASTPPRTLAFVESGAAVKGATDVLAAAARATEISRGKDDRSDD